MDGGSKEELGNGGRRERRKRKSKERSKERKEKGGREREREGKKEVREGSTSACGNLGVSSAPLFELINRKRLILLLHIINHLISSIIKFNHFDELQDIHR